MWVAVGPAVESIVCSCVSFEPAKPKPAAEVSVPTSDSEAVGGVSHGWAVLFLLIVADQKLGPRLSFRIEAIVQVVP